MSDGKQPNAGADKVLESKFEVPPKMEGPPSFPGKIRKDKPKRDPKPYTQNPRNTQGKEKQGVPVTGFGTRIENQYRVQLSFAEMKHISDEIYASFIAFDHKYVPRVYSRHAFTLVNQLAVAIRVIYVNIHLQGYKIDVDFPKFWDFYQSFKKLRLHNVVADYIESIGAVEYDGMRSVPYLHSIDSLFEDLECTRFITVEGKHVDDPQDQTPYTLAEAIERVDFTAYIQCTGRVAELSRAMRIVDWESTDGNLKMLVSRHTDGVTHYGVATTNMRLYDFEIGAMFNFWTSTRRRTLGSISQYPNRFKGINFMPDVTLNTMIQKTLGR